MNKFLYEYRTGDQVLSEVQELGARDRAGEYIMMRLRTVGGVDPREYEKRFLLSFAPMEKYLQQCKDRGFAVKTFDGRWHLTPNGFLISNAIISDLMVIQEAQ